MDVPLLDPPAQCRKVDGEVNKAMPMALVICPVSAGVQMDRTTTALRGA
jgi:hypothetical protein